MHGLYVVLGALSKSNSVQKPHIVMHLADDFGWADAGWHRPPGYREVQTPMMDQLVKEGIELDQAYSFEFCSPTRSSLQSGRLPVHVNMVNLAPDMRNPRDPISGFAGIPRAMTGIAHKMKQGGYVTHQVGKWDAGMATVDHTPHGRGYDTSFGYFHHANDYWNEHVGPFVDLYNETEHTTWAGPGPAFRPTDGAAYGFNGSCTAGNYPPIGRCGMTGPEHEYEEFKFKTRNLEIIHAHDATAPLFLCYTSHIVHEPLQVPNSTWNHFNFVQHSTAGDFNFHRQTYHAMVYYMDGVVGEMVQMLKSRKMWENTLWFFQSDNGGPSFAGSSHTANNFPMRGSKMTNWQGGIRVNAFVSGGLLKTAAPKMIGTKIDGFTHVCDWYTTWSTMAGVDWHDQRAEEAKLPPVDGLDLWPYLSGVVKKSPRTEVFAHPNVLLLELNGVKWKLFGDGYRDAQFYNPETVGVPAGPLSFNPNTANCSAHNSGVCLKGAPMIKSIPLTTDADCCAACIEIPECVAWNTNTELKKCFFRKAAGPTDQGSMCNSGQVRPSPPPPPPGPVGHVSVAVGCWAGPQYPNATVNPACNHTESGPIGLLYNLDLDPNETNNVAAENPDVLAKLTTRLRALQPTVFSPDRGTSGWANKDAIARGDFWGPFVFP